MRWIKSFRSFSVNPIHIWIGIDFGSIHASK
jgi:hypothetical protein